MVGGFQPNGPHELVGQQLGLEWPVRPHEPAWVIHLPGGDIRLTQDRCDMLDIFPESESFWKHQAKIADLGWALAAQGLPWPPTNLAEMKQLIQLGIAHFPQDLSLIPVAFQNAYRWMQPYELTRNPAFMRFIDGQLMISAQTTSRNANALYSATALDLPRQGVYHVVGGIGGLAETLVAKIRAARSSLSAACEANSH